VMRKTKAYRAGVILERVHMGPSFSAMPSDWAELGITDRAQAQKLEQHFAKQYSLWAGSWVRPELEELLPK